MAAIVFPLDTMPGARLGESRGRLLNAYADRLGESTMWRRAPGISTLATVSATGPRGMIEVNGAVYIAYAGVILRMAKDGTGQVVLTGALPGTDGVTFARNNRVTAGASTPDIVVVRSTGGAYVVSGTTVAAYPSANLPATVNSVSFLGGYFIFSVPDGRFFASELNSTTINALSFASAESSPDGLRRAISYANRVYAMGEATIEIWGNVGTQPFPLARADTVIPVGIKATMAVAGMDAEWGLAPFFAASDDTFRELSGYGAEIVSTPPVTRFIAASDASTLEACVFDFRGNAHFALTSSTGTHVFDATNRRWHQRASDGRVNWRASRSLKIDGRWMVADRVATGGTSKVGFVQEGLRTEHSAPLAATLDSMPVKDFPARIAIPAAFLDFTESDGCTANIYWSMDGEKTWVGPDVMPLDDADIDPIRLSSLGMTTQHGIRVRVVVSDDADFSLLGGNIPDPQARAA